MYYNYLCTYGKSKRCECPKGKKCSILLTPEDTARYELMNELVCGPILDEPAVIHFPDSFPQINVVISDECPTGSSDYDDDGGGGGSGGDGGSGDDEGGGGDASPPLCLDSTIYEERIGSYRLGLYFKEPSSPDPALPVVLLIHGMGSQCGRWDDYYARWFARDGYRVAAVNLFPHNTDAPPEVRGWMFHPNGIHLNKFIDTLHAYINRNYHGWNNKIIAVAHSRAGLEMEDVLYIRHNTHIDGVIALATPFYGSKIADIGVGFCTRDIVPYIACSRYLFTPVYFPCVSAVKFIRDVLCDSFPPDMYILTTPAINNWRKNAHVDDRIDTKPVKFHIGIGWTPEWKCSPFEDLNQAGCVVIKYLQWGGCNDGAVTFSTNYDRWKNFRYRTFIFSQAPDNFKHLCSGDPQVWEKDHTQIVESQEVYSDVEREVQYIDTFGIYLSEGGRPFSFPKALPEEYPVEVYSRSFLTLVDTSYLFVNLDMGEDSILVWSKKPLEFNYAAAVDSQRLGRGKLYEIHSHLSTFGIKTSRIDDGSDELEGHTSDSHTSPVAIFFTDGEPLYVWLNKSVYLEGEPIYIKIRYPGKDTLYATFLNLSRSRVYWVDGFYERGDTSIAVTSLPSEGLYKLFVFSFKRGMNGDTIAPRTAIATIVVVKSKERVIDVLMGKYLEKGEEGSHHRNDATPASSTTQGNYLRVHLKKGTYTIYNASGQRLKTGHVKDGLVPLSGLKRGVFFVIVGNKVYKIVR
ncbi:MAG: hypothetical protein GXO39_02260 [Thermotogae bacterium]|nr:hypothetical protein [Thermotogota bacterium]